MDQNIQLRENDLLITKDGTIGKTAIIHKLPDKACLNAGIFVIRPISDDYIIAYLYWVLNSPIFTAFINYQTKTGTTISHLYQYIFVDFAFPIPSIPEQVDIATFLNHKTSHINALIAAKERQIELLQEKHDAFINNAVTKGLDTNVPVKDSGIEWVGEIPEHWQVIKFRRFTRLQQGLQIAQVERFAEPGSNRYEYITIQSIHSHDNSNKEYIENPHKSVVCQPNDILLARTGATGEVITKQYGVFHNNFFKMEYDHKKVDKEYLVYYLSDALVKENLLVLAGTTTVPDLGHGDFLDFPFLAPPLSEQSTIVDYLDQKIRAIDELKKKVEESIDKLREYRDSLIFAVVTGKIDVRKEGS